MKQREDTLRRDFLDICIVGSSLNQGRSSISVLKSRTRLNSIELVQVDFVAWLWRIALWKVTLRCQKCAKLLTKSLRMPDDFIKPPRKEWYELENGL